MIVVVEPAVAYGETNMYKNNTYRVREGVVNLTMINPTPIASVYDIVYSIRSAIAPKDDPVSFVTEGLTPAIKYRHGKVATKAATTRGWGRCLKVTLQTCVPENFR